MVWLRSEYIRFLVPKRVDGFVGCFETERLELLGEVVGCQPVPDVTPNLIDRRVVERSYGRFLDDPDHAFGLAVSPRVNRNGFVGGVSS